MEDKAVCEKQESQTQRIESRFDYLLKDLEEKSHIIKDRIKAIKNYPEEAIKEPCSDTPTPSDFIGRLDSFCDNLTDTSSRFSECIKSLNKISG